MTKNSMVSSSQSSTLLSSSSVSTPRGEVRVGAQAPPAPALRTHACSQPGRSANRQGPWQRTTDTDAKVWEECESEFFDNLRPITPHFTFTEKSGKLSQTRKEKNVFNTQPPARQVTSSQFQTLVLLLHVEFLGHLPVLPEVFHHSPPPLHQFLGAGQGVTGLTLSHHDSAEPTPSPVPAAAHTRQHGPFT